VKPDGPLQNFFCGIGLSEQAEREHQQSCGRRNRLPHQCNQPIHVTQDIAPYSIVRS
jgi:hypothetical protein